LLRPDEMERERRRDGDWNGGVLENSVGCMELNLSRLRVAREVWDGMGWHRIEWMG
jgi:hypothetical protein